MAIGVKGGASALSTDLGDNGGGGGSGSPGDAKGEASGLSSEPGEALLVAVAREAAVVSAGEVGEGSKDEGVLPYWWCEGVGGGGVDEAWSAVGVRRVLNTSDRMSISSRRGPSPSPVFLVLILDFGIG